MVAFPEDFKWGLVNKIHHSLLLPIADEVKQADDPGKIIAELWRGTIQFTCCSRLTGVSQNSSMFAGMSKYFEQ